MALEHYAYVESEEQLAALNPILLAQITVVGMRIEGPGVQRHFDSAQLPALRKLVIYNVRDCGVATAQAVAKFLRAHPKLELFSYNNDMDDTSWRFIYKALKVHPGIEALNLMDNMIGERGVKRVCRLLAKSRTLTTLELCRRSLSEIAIRDICAALEDNEYLRELSLYDQKIKKRWGVYFARMLERNNTLCAIWGAPVFPHECIFDALAQKNRALQYLESCKPLRAKNDLLRRNQALAAMRLDMCARCLVHLLGMRKLRRSQSGLLSIMPRDVLRYVIAPRIWTTRQRVEWDFL